MMVAHHSRHVNWFEVGRLELMRAAGLDYGRLENEGFFLPVVGLEIRYRAPSQFDDVIEIETCMENRSRARILFTYRLTRLRDGALLATGYSEHATVNRDFRPTRLPKKMLDLLDTRCSYPVPEDPC